MGIKIRRAYEHADDANEYRVLVDRLWPRGIKKSNLKIDEWAKVLAPSTTLRKSFGHDPAHWQEFQRRYKAELNSVEARKKLDELAERAQKDMVILIYGAKDETHNQAVVLKEILEAETHKRDESKDRTGIVEHASKRMKKDT